MGVVEKVRLLCGSKLPRTHFYSPDQRDRGCVCLLLHILTLIYMDCPVLRGDGQEFVLTIGSFLTPLISVFR
jgi:hypothetical protein